MSDFDAEQLRDTLIDLRKLVDTGAGLRYGGDGYALGREEARVIVERLDAQQAEIDTLRAENRRLQNESYIIRGDK